MRKLEKCWESLFMDREDKHISVVMKMTITKCEQMFEKFGSAGNQDLWVEEGIEH